MKSFCDILKEGSKQDTIEKFKFSDSKSPQEAKSMLLKDVGTTNIRVKVLKQNIIEVRIFDNIGSHKTYQLILKLLKKLNSKVEIVK